MQPSKSQNPTVKHILNCLKVAEEHALEVNAYVTVRQKREVIDLIENYLSERTNHKT